MSTRASWAHHRWLVVGACLIVFVTARLIASLVFEQAPHLEDEVAYLFQAQLFSAGRVYAPSPPQPDCFHMPFIVDHEGRRFGKYPPGWPALLVIGVWMGQVWWVNAALAALTVALTFRLGRETGNGPLTSAIAAWLAATSPFVLLLAGSMMAHTACLPCVTAFPWCFRQTCRPTGVHARWRWALVAGLALGCAFAIRPFTAAVVAVPACLYTLWRLARYREWRRACLMALGFAPLVLVGFYVNLLWTGDPLLPAYALAWPFDRPGFGPGHGPGEAGHTLLLGVNNIVVPLWLLASHLHGWPGVSLAFVVALFLFKPRRFWDVFLAATSLSLALAYGAYWTTGDLFGPRYLYEGASALFILSAAGIVRVGRWVRGRGLGWWRAYGHARSAGGREPIRLSACAVPQVSRPVRHHRRASGDTGASRSARRPGDRGQRRGMAEVRCAFFDERADSGRRRDLRQGVPAGRGACRRLLWPARLHLRRAGLAAPH